MALTHGDALLRDTARAAFWTSYESYPSIFDGIIAEVTSNADQETYAWLGHAPAVREMVGGRQKRAAPQLTYTITNKQYENTVAIDYATRKYNKNGAVAAMLSNLGAKAAANKDKLASTILDLGDSTACYDGQYFFDTDHTDPGGKYTSSQVNYSTVNVTGTAAPTDLEFATAVRTMRNALMGYLDNEGDPVFSGVLDASNFVIMINPEYHATALRVLNADSLTGPLGNELRGTFQIRVNPFLPSVSASSNHGFIYGFNIGGRRKPLIYQVAEPVSLADDMGGDNEFNTRDVSFGTFAYYGIGYGDWRYAYMYDFT